MSQRLAIPVQSTLAELLQMLDMDARDGRFLTNTFEERLRHRRELPGNGPGEFVGFDGSHPFPLRLRPFDGSLRAQPRLCEEAVL